mmetsp:Transcript_22632/g.40508  ORF Transcript_22632/g.40508 Transcript_22632/m.40508 type:complete len:80 (-) Transcript_22632:768-1007(-)
MDGAAAEEEDSEASPTAHPTNKAKMDAVVALDEGVAVEDGAAVGVVAVVVDSNIPHHAHEGTAFYPSNQSFEFHQSSVD